MFENLKIKNPKLSFESRVGRENFYSFYPGFSWHFAQSLIASTKLPSRGKILDPWNGSGTTTSAGASLGYKTIGFDLNPVMIISAKARMLSRRVKNSLQPIAKDILFKAVKEQSHCYENSDPLCRWLYPSSAKTIRAIEIAIQSLLLENSPHRPPTDSEINSLSDLAAFYYVALFRVLREILKDFVPTNPTWVKYPKSKSKRLRPQNSNILLSFSDQVQQMFSCIEEDGFHGVDHENQGRLEIASSEMLPVENASINFVLGSPPYCTRIDYAVATSPELALLGFDNETLYNNLRKSLIGTSTVPKSVDPPRLQWGKTCLNFLQRVKSHQSKASATYYYKNHVQYFSAINSSIMEINRVLKKNSGCVLVVQDSFYKEVYNDLPQIIVEMAGNSELDLIRRQDHKLATGMGGIKTQSSEHRTKSEYTESVLCFVRK